MSIAALERYKNIPGSFRYFSASAGADGVVPVGHRVAILAVYFNSNGAGDTLTLEDGDGAASPIHLQLETDSGGEFIALEFPHPIILNNGLSVNIGGAGTRRAIVVYRKLDAAYNIAPGS